jgi:PAS domain-containing protein
VNTLSTTAPDDRTVVADDAFEWVWPTTFVAALISLWVPWYVRTLDVDIGRITWLFTVSAGIHVLAAPAIERIGGARGRDAALLTLHGLSLFALGFAWILLGATDVPLFVIFFAPSAIAAQAIRGVWGRATAFGLAFAVPPLAALVASPSLRWYGMQIGLQLGPLDSFAERLGSFAPPEHNVAPAATAVSLGLVAAALAALYACASGFAAANRDAIGWLHQTIAALRKDKGLALELLQSSPLPEALLLPESARVILVNDRFRTVFGADGAETEGVRLAELVKLQFPEALEQLVKSGDGTVDGRCPGPGGRLREVRVHVRRSKHEGAHVARVSFEDRTAERQLEGALDTVEIILLILDADDALIYANPAARELFADAERGAAAAAVLRHPDLPNRWWRTPEDTSLPREISIAGKEYRGKVVCRRSDSLAEPATVITLSAGQT